MLNIEKYEKEIIDIGLNNFGYTKDNNIKRCADTHCCDCVFCDNRRCSTRKTVEWLASEYKAPILDDKGKNYIKTLVSPFRVDDIVTIVKHSINNGLRYELIVNLVHAQMYVYFDRESMVGEMLAKMKSNHSYNAKELGLC